MALISKPNKLLHALPISLLFLMLATNVHSQDATSFGFSRFTGNESDLIYQGDAHVPSGSNYIRLTRTNTDGSPQPHSVGRVLYSKPVRLWDRPGSRIVHFSNYFSFILEKPVGDPADGFVFFLAPINSTIPSGSDAGNFGIYDSSGTSSIFATEFDIFVNSWDPDYRHFGININSRNSTRVGRWDWDSTVDPTRVYAGTIYQGRHRLLYVDLQTSQGTSRVSSHIDFKTILPEWVQVGISASTGEGSLIHDIRSWTFSSHMEYDENDIIENEYNNKNNSTNVEEDTYIRQYV